MINSNGNPMPLIQQFMGNATPELRNQVLGRAKQLGVPNNILTQIQNIK
jgi:hypothetical protein